MISLDLMKLSEVRIAGDQPNNICLWFEPAFEGKRSELKYNSLIKKKTGSNVNAVVY